MAIFRGFKPQGMQKIAQQMGYKGSMQDFDNYLQQNPEKQRQMIVYEQAAMQMANGGVVPQMNFYTPKQGETLLKNTPTPNMPYTTVMPDPDGEYAYKSDGTRVTVPRGYFDNLSMKPPPQTPDPRPLIQQYTPSPQPTTAETSIGDVSAQRMTQPGVPQGGITIPMGTSVASPQLIPQDTAKLTDPRTDVTTATAQTTQSIPPATTQAQTVTPEQVATQIGSTLDAVETAKTDENDPRAKIIAAEQTASSVTNLKGAQGTATLLENPVQRQIQTGELVTGAADAEKASKFTEQIQAATATPTEKATVQGQLALLTQNFDAKNPPAWAAGAIRGVQSIMQQRGLGASSIAGQALVQAAMESALPVAQADASIFAQFENQNLSNRQARAMLAAQQRAQFIGQEFDQQFQARVQNASRISDIANMNFNADQQIALENSRAVNTMNLNNLSNSQAMVMAEASALANMDTANLNNRQQSAVQNAQNFLQMDMANLSNQQQTELFKAQQRTQALFTDQAAVNASQQFNATSQNQVDQFFANLASQVSQFNATQANAQAQFNAGQENTIERFNAEVNNQRDQFNAQNQLVIAQNNAQWRRAIATADTVAVNRANELNASAVLDISKQGYANLWNFYKDSMEWAWKSAENELDRITTLATTELQTNAQKEVQELAGSSAAGTAIGGLIGTLGSAYIKGKFGVL